MIIIIEVETQILRQLITLNARCKEQGLPSYNNDGSKQHSREAR